jgi:hypothetical protein
VGIALVLIPGFLEGPLMRRLTRIPKIGGAMESLLDAVRIYRSKRLVLFLTSLMTIPVHGLLTVSLFWLALGLRLDQVPLSDYFAIYPISGIAQTIPLPAGPAESGIVFFYETAWLRLPENQAQINRERGAEKLKKAEELAEAGGDRGLILALVYRVSTILIVPIGAAYYFLGGRSEVTEVLHEAEEGGSKGAH